jgi:hypothetical protein
LGSNAQHCQPAASKKLFKTPGDLKYALGELAVLGITA